MTGEPRWHCQEASVISIHQLPPQAEASSVKAARYLSIHGFQSNVLLQLQPGPLQALEYPGQPLPCVCVFLKEEWEAHLPGSSRVGVASCAHSNSMEDTGGLRSSAISVPLPVPRRGWCQRTSFVSVGCNEWQTTQRT